MPFRACQRRTEVAQDRRHRIEPVQAVGATRIDLSGQPSGIVSQEHAVATIEKLAKGGEHYKKTTGVAKPPVQTLEEQGVDKHLAKPPPKPAPLPPVRRMSLRDLREAAARRKAGAS